MSANLKERQNLKEGYYTELSNKDYHSLDGISSTTLSDLGLSIAIWTHRHIFKHHRVEYDFGNLVHDALAYPDNFKENYLECETTGLQTAKADKQREENPDKIVVAKGSFSVVEEIVKKVHLVYHSYINTATKETSFIVDDEQTGLTYKARPDLHLVQHGIILDYKTTKETTHKGFLATIEKYNYHRSAAFYIDVVNSAIDKFKLPFRKVTQFGWICIPKQEPYKPFGFVASDELVEKGRDDYQRLIDKLVEVRQNSKDELFKTAYSYEYRKENF